MNFQERRRLDFTVFFVKLDVVIAGNALAQSLVIRILTRDFIHIA